jgi:hypothetical protein
MRASQTSRRKSYFTSLSRPSVLMKTSTDLFFYVFEPYHHVRPLGSPWNCLMAASGFFTPWASGPNGRQTGSGIPTISSGQIGHEGFWHHRQSQDRQQGTQACRLGLNPAVNLLIHFLKPIRRRSQSPQHERSRPRMNASFNIWRVAVPFGSRR